MASAIQQLSEDVESLKNILVAKACGERANEFEYSKLRKRLMKEPLVKDQLPRFVRTCGNLGEFLPYIKETHATYAGRRRFLSEQFEEVLTYLEQESANPSGTSINPLLTKVETPHIAAAWQQAIDQQATDPSGAITSANTLLETVCKHILDEQEITYANTDDLPKLYQLVADSLTLSPSQHTEQVFRQILGGCQAVVEGLGAMMNQHSDAQGVGKAGVRPAARHAELAVDLAGTMATFLLATWEAKQK